MASITQKTAEIGSEGLLRANIHAPQGATCAFQLKHLDYKGRGIDHEGYIGYMSVIVNGVDTPLDDCLSFDGTSINVVIPAELTASLPVGSHPYDVMVDDGNGVVTRLLYGNVIVTDTYAMDEL